MNIITPSKTPEPSPHSANSIPMTYRDVGGQGEVAVGLCIPITICEPCRGRETNWTGYLRVGSRIPGYGEWKVQINLGDADWMNPQSHYIENGEVFAILPAWTRAGRDNDWNVRCIRTR